LDEVLEVDLVRQGLLCGGEGETLLRTARPLQRLEPWQAVPARPGPGRFDGACGGEASRGGDKPAALGGAASVRRGVQTSLLSSNALSMAFSSSSRASKLPRASISSMI
jgi:hypothetical protein